MRGLRYLRIAGIACCDASRCTGRAKMPLRRGQRGNAATRQRGDFCGKSPQESRSPPLPLAFFAQRRVDGVSGLCWLAGCFHFSFIGTRALSSRERETRVHSERSLGGRNVRSKRDTLASSDSHPRVDFGTSCTSRSSAIRLVALATAERVREYSLPSSLPPPHTCPLPPCPLPRSYVRARLPA